MQPSFYRAFEDRYRGSRQLIRSRLEAYAPFVKPFLTVDQDSAQTLSALDLGCGRGEWMELLRDWGFAAHGVDLDEGMLAACRDIGLEVTRGDALDYMRSLPDSSHAIVSAFHVVEHIPFDALELLVAESLRILRPGGLLILETPNPENLIVGTERFHLDPTHSQPIPHLLLSFLLEHRGFHRVKVLPLQEPAGIREKQEPGLLDVVAGVSPDYGAIGQKAASPQQLAPWDGAFNGTYGQGLLDLANRFDNTLARRTETLAASVDHVSRELQASKDGHMRRFQELSQHNAEHLRRFHEMSQQIEHLARTAREAQQQTLAAIRAQHEAERQQLVIEFRHQDMARSQLLVSTQQQLAAAQEQAHLLHLHVQDIYRSISWRLTAPLRWIRRHLRPREKPVAATESSRPDAGRSDPARTTTAVQSTSQQAAVAMPATPLTPTGHRVYHDLQAARAEKSSR